MIDFNQFPMHKKPYADNTLRCMPRKELIAYIRDIEHNYETLYWFYQNAVNANLEKFKDFERVVRCKGCKHWDGYYCHNKRWGDGYGNYTPPIKAEDGYCDWSERKDNG